LYATYPKYTTPGVNVNIIWREYKDYFWILGCVVFVSVK